MSIIATKIIAAGNRTEFLKKEALIRLLKNDW